jgi:hypothetical protein
MSPAVISSRCFLLSFSSIPASFCFGLIIQLTHRWE